MVTNTRLILLFLVCVLSFFKGSANAIDSIKTKEDVIKFLDANFGKVYHNTFFEKSDLPGRDSMIWEQIGKNGFRSDSFYKADIDNDGRTDLIVDGLSSFIVMDTGNKYVMHHIESGPPRYFFRETIQLPDQSIALLFRLDSWLFSHDSSVGCCSNVKTISRIDTIIYKFGGLVEYNKHPTSVN